MKLLALTLAAITINLAGAQIPAPTSIWAHLGPDGHLVYAASKEGDHFTDFSYAGYRGGGVAIPNAPVAEILQPSGDDDTAAMQAAIHRIDLEARISNKPRALLLAPGAFHLSAAIQLANNVVLRGSGRDKTILQLIGKPHFGVQLGATASPVSLDEDTPDTVTYTATVTAAKTTLPDTYIPSGVHRLPVISTAGFAAGDTIIIKRSIPDSYVKFMGMDRLVRDGNVERWVGDSISTERRIITIRDGALWLDVPLTDDFDPRFGGGSNTTVTNIPPPNRLHDSGVESLTIQAAAASVDYHSEHFDGIQITSAEDVWLRDLALIDTVNFVRIESAARRITIDHVDLTEHDTVSSSAKPFGFSLGGTQILVMRSTAHGNKLTFAATQSRMMGPNVVLQCDFTGDQALEPHQRWSTGFLVDSTHVHGGGAIRFINRGEMGSGHGWTIGWSVVWNSSADSLIIQQPPGSANWAIGSTGPRGHQGMPIKGSRGHNGAALPEGIFDSYNKPVAPASLYLQQLTDRLGPQAVTNILH